MKPLALIFGLISFNTFAQIERYCGQVSLIRTGEKTMISVFKKNYHRIWDEADFEVAPKMKNFSNFEKESKAEMVSLASVAYVHVYVACFDEVGGVVKSVAIARWKPETKQNQ